MKRFSLFLSICILPLVSETTLAQVAADYYLQLSVGRNATLHTVGTMGSGWSARTTTYSIEGSDVIAGRQYFREKGTEYTDRDIWLWNVFHVFWLRKDYLGNVALGAMSTTGSSNIDSAIVVSGTLFPNEFLTKGYSITYAYGKETWQDSVLSVTETVSVSAGTFKNCLKISESHFDSTRTTVWREYHYYAYGVGMVKNERTIPGSTAHTDELTGYGTTGVSNGAVNQIPQNFSLLQNYPNPFNPTTRIEFDLPKDSRVSLIVYNVLGQVVTRLVEGPLGAGSYSYNFVADRLGAGVYYYVLTADEFRATKKMILLK